MHRLNVLDWIAMILVIIGGINWGLLGLFAVNVVSAIFGDMTWITRLIYVLVGASAAYVAVVMPNLRRTKVEDRVGG